MMMLNSPKWYYLASELLLCIQSRPEIRKNSSFSAYEPGGSREPNLDHETLVPIDLNT